MSEIKEIELTKVTELLATDYIRGIRVSDGESVDILRSDFRLTLENIIDLVTALAGKQDIATVLSSIAFSRADGTVNGGGFTLGTLASEAEMNLAFNGIYTVETPFVAASPLGTILGVIAMSNDKIGQTPTATTPKTSKQIIFTAWGIFYRTYSSATWYNPMFLGGTPANFTITKADAVTYAGDSKLTPGVLYQIVDHDNDKGIIIQAATSSTFYSEGIRLGLVPAHYEAGTFDTNVWLGVWNLGLTPSIGDKVVFMGRVWTNLNGNVGIVSLTDPWSLESYNWSLDTVESGTSYTDEVFGCVYNLAADYISKQWDSRGNVFGEPIESVDGFLIEYNDWGNAFVYNNVVKTCRNNIAVDATTAIYKNNGNGDIHSNSNCLIYDNIVTDENNNIVSNTSCTIHKNTLTRTADIEGNTTCTFEFNIVGGDLKTNTSCTVEKSTLTQRIKDCVLLTITESKIEGRYEDNTRIHLTNVWIQFGATLWNKTSATGHTISNSVLTTDNTSTETYTADKYVRDDITPFKPTTGETLRLETPDWEDIIVYAANLRAGASAPSMAILTGTIYSLAFANGASNVVYGAFEIPHGYKEGTALYPHIHWSPSSTNTGRCDWTFAYSIANSNAAFGAETGLTIQQAGSGVALQHQKADTNAVISGTGRKVGDICIFALTRPTGDAFTGDAFLHSVGVHYQKDTLGSRTISAK